MTNPKPNNHIGTYSFLPWLRQGIANQIGKTTSNQKRATIPISLKIKGDPIKGAAPLGPIIIPENIQLFGPGDIVGSNSRAIIKVEPHHWITNFEPNYLPYIDFYDEDFPWRYTPTAPDKAKHRLSPWIMLVVLKGAEEENAEFEDGKTIKGKPLPYIKITVPDVKTVFPPADQLWAWAHVHVNQDLILSQDDIVSKDQDIETIILPKFQKMLAQNPDVAYSRILCPRRLDANAGYHAFLIPVFETGRLAGLGLDPSKAPSATHSAWEHYDAKKEFEPNHYPYYHHWYFRTGTVGDFEYLVRLLQPKPVDKRVGTRAMDVQNPGSNLPGINTDKVKGVLRLGGALKVPKSTPPDDDWAQPYPQEFQRKLAAFINLADDYAQKGALKANEESGLWEVVNPDDGEESASKIDPDPLITPPLYGRWHSLTQRLLSDRQGTPVENQENWVHTLNLDPRFRVAAGFGTRVIQDQQEDYMHQAWAQVGDILEANQHRRNAQLALTSSSWYARHLTPLMAAQPEKACAFMAPVHSRIVCQGTTAAYRLKTSIVPKAAVSTTMRRLMRPRGRLMQALSFTDSIRPDNLLDRINSGEVSAAPVRGTPTGIITMEVFARILAERIPQAPEALSEENQIPERVDGLPESGHFDIFRPEDELPILPPGGPDSPEAERFKIALRDMYSVFVASKEVSEEPTPSSLDLSALTECLFHGLNPDITIPRRIRQMEQLPARLEVENGEDFTEVMVYPEFDIPMYKPLKDISSELFLPNINLIEQNSITLLETNQPFIESYMVGLNHEMGRELLWREYPTDQRGSYFRQFWDASSYYDPKAPDADERREKLKDIPPLHLWSKTDKTGALGKHDHRETGEDEEELVLVIRGELLKKYPTAVIYAHRARWQMKDGKVDNTVARLPIKLEAAEREKPPRNKVKSPLYSAKVEPDIYFFGFDLTPVEAKGGTGVKATKETDESGWFFVIKERPGEPRFGLDVGEAGDLDIWNDLSWKHVLPGDSPGSFIQITENSPSFPLTNLPKGHKKKAQQDQDKQVEWNKDTNSADLAYILYQTPVLVAVHAAEMLQPF
ncbi:hypothetical protein Lepto7375DRAFT_3751 [Leptolyngbya sp. PCC 7375]|nr:hypothetical protein Lepto7375DRAFT_3751 [Leptolyngbya sp. PCC 7375]